VIGWNGRMDGMQGAILSVKLKHLEKWTEARRANAKRYDQLLRNAHGILAPIQSSVCRHVYHLYVVRVKDRDALIKTLGEQGITCAIHYPLPLHLQEAYKPMGIAAGSFPVAERVAKEIVSLPMYPELTADEVQTVAAAVKEFAAEERVLAN
jgi:dTDP-4-amino-4,6-dideoxygalactose transaminase